MRRIILVLLIVSLSMEVLFSAGQKEQSDPNNITIGVLSEFEQPLKTIIASPDFKKKFPQLTITIKPADFGSHHNRLITQIAANTGAYDIEMIEKYYIARFAADGGLTDLAKAPFNGVGKGKDLARYAMSNATTNEGKLLALPFTVEPAVLFVRKSEYSKMHNLENFDAYVKRAKALKKKGKYALAHPADIGFVTLNGGGGDWFQDGNPYKPKKRFKAHLQIIQNIQKAGIAASLTPWSNRWKASFKNTKYVTTFGGASHAKHLQTMLDPNHKGKWRVTSVPGKTKASYGGIYFAIPEQTALNKKNKCWEIITYLSTNKNAQLSLFKQTKLIPALTTVYNDNAFNERVPYFGGQQIYKFFTKIVADIPVQNLSEYDALAVDIFNKAIAEVIKGTPVNKAYENAIKEILKQM